MRKDAKETLVGWSQKYPISDLTSTRDTIQDVMGPTHNDSQLRMSSTAQLLTHLVTKPRSREAIQRAGHSQGLKIRHDWTPNV